MDGEVIAACTVDKRPEILRRTPVVLGRGPFAYPEIVAALSPAAVRFEVHFQPIRGETVEHVGPWVEEGIADWMFTGSPKVKSACAGGASRPERKHRPTKDVTTIGISNSFISHLPFCPKAIRTLLQSHLPVFLQKDTSSQPNGPAMIRTEGPRRAEPNPPRRRPLTIADQRLMSALASDRSCR